MVNSKQTGFTLVELIMVIVMLGILSATALPKFFEKNTFAERVFFDDTLNAVRYAQKLAVATGCEVEVSFTLTEYSLKRPANKTQCGKLSPPPSFDLDVMHPSTGGVYEGSEPGIAFESVPPTVIFNALGESSVSASGNDIKINTRTITIVKETGFVYAP